jgi:hypothetical protein
MRIEIDFTKFSDLSLLYFLTPRALKNEIDEEF